MAVLLLGQKPSTDFSRCRTAVDSSVVATVNCSWHNHAIKPVHKSPYSAPLPPPPPPPLPPPQINQNNKQTKNTTLSYHKCMWHKNHSRLVFGLAGSVCATGILRLTPTLARTFLRLTCVLFLRLHLKRTSHFSPTPTPPPPTPPPSPPAVTQSTIFGGNCQKLHLQHIGLSTGAWI